MITSPQQSTTLFAQKLLKMVAGYVCVRGFDQKTRAPRPLMARLHLPASKLTTTKGKTDDKTKGKTDDK